MEKISNKEAIALIVTIIVNNFVLVTAQIIVETCSSASLLNALYVSLVAILLTWIICILFKRFNGQDILDISNFLGGKLLKSIVGIVFLGYLLLRISILLRRLTNCLQIINYPVTNIVYLILIFIIAGGIVSNFKNRCIPKAIYILLPIILASIVLSFIGNQSNFDYNAIYPILGHGIDSTFFSGLSNLAAFSGIVYLYFLPPDLKEPHKFKKIAIISIVLSAIFLLITIGNILFMFDNILSSSELFPSYLVVRYIEFGPFFQRLDSIFLLIWNISFISVFSIVVNLCINIFKKTTNLTDEKPIIYPVLLTIFGITLLINKNSILRFLEADVSRILFFSVVIGLSLLILLLANIKYKISSKKKGANNE